MDALLKDLRFALRTLGKSPGFSAVVVLTLGLGIGANTAIFTLLDQVLLRLLPVERPEELVLLDGPGANMGARFGEQVFSYPMYRDFRDRNEVFSGVIARFGIPLSLEHKGQTERARGELVSGNFFEVLGVKAALGRTLGASDDVTPGGHPVAVLGHGFWQRRFGADPRVVGETIKVNSHAFTVLGVAAPGFNGIEVGASPDLYLPIAMKAQATPTWNELENRRSAWLNLMARLEPGMSREQAAAGLQVLYRQINEQELLEMPHAAGALPGALPREAARSAPGLPGPLLPAPAVHPAAARPHGHGRPRPAHRVRQRGEPAPGPGRLSGAGDRDPPGPRREPRPDREAAPGRRALLLAVLGGAAGLLLASWVGEALLRALPFEEAGRVLTGAPDSRVLLFTLVVSLLTGVVFGLVPAWQGTRPRVAGVLKEESGSVAGGGHVRFRKGLVVAQVALSLLLLVGAGLFARSLYNLRSLDPGFDGGRTS